ncbi:MAG: 2-hydroxychromene-2-carboxylate isomerase [Pseudomonadales bacterium]|jgi:2-hydroxychromene-2-carboxylate isomerase|nr:2-hydroxychromene-2-carboxylate isomerase [Pseudomonadales bacterium]MDP6472990.1 2-hydroxychromene-2-carboxylate isomerase [Pseudomonadales bacterium]MDP6826254.1 2-hydroxychromene-2-carboxylate isomerase [Pseudomonadales bacterium]MDP6970816.1 2-hydroxychromene-2-carboxylate isomerase [Pseudomonadales bacterium]
MHRLEFFFDCSSPWTYLAFEALQPLAQLEQVHTVWKPILVGGVFNSVNPSVYENRANPVPAKARYYQKDLADWARHQGLEIGQPPVFPVNSVKIMRGAFVAMEQGLLVPYARRAFRRYWSELADISQDEEVIGIARDAGLDGEALLRATRDQRYKDQLRDNTDELIRRDGFGSPTMFVDGDDMYFGNDRLTLVAQALGV